jgi:hypothetical protein
METLRSKLKLSFQNPKKIYNLEGFILGLFLRGFFEHYIFAW